jgi:hypothetical protein
VELYYAVKEEVIFREGLQTAKTPHTMTGERQEDNRP